MDEEEEEEGEDVAAAEAITFALGSAPEMRACGYELNTRQRRLSARTGAT